MLPKIAIIGAGPGGLTLASVLQESSIPYKIYDLRPKPLTSNFQMPCGTLDLHEESGLLALDACGLLPAFHSRLAECSEDILIADKHGIMQYQDNGRGANRPEISRDNLTAILLSTLPENAVSWEQRVQSISAAPDGDGKWKVCLQNGEEIFDLVIGADGAWSRVRPILTDAKPYFSSINCITLSIPHITKNYPHLATLVGTGSYHSSGGDRSLMSQRGSLDSARLYLMISSASESFLQDKGLDTAGAKELEEKLLNDTALFSTWGCQQKELIRVACEEELKSGLPISAKPLYMLEPGLKWAHKTGVTLIGDAAHLTTPFAGEGVNSAMLDALQLGRGVITACEKEESIDAAVQKYEAEMFHRAEAVAHKTLRNLKMIFAEDAPKGFVEWFLSHVPPAEEGKDK